ncbi:translational activator of GCN4 [Polyrhizophydium stewartii]|uniref:Translational activator of GCN4 n=1 Tax=Polyrhizophydium stewartii TaxID=2732419 RepID=A0ABR4MW96_9FUNG
MWNDRPVRSSAELGQRALVTLLSVLPPSPDEALKPTLVLALMDLAVIMSLPLMVHLHGADLWVRMCFRCDLDPREVLEQHAASYIGNWLHSTSRDVTIGGLAEALPAAIRAATVSCLRLATEVATDVVLPLVLPFAFEILRDDSLAQVSRTDVLIWATPADELFDDPLQKKAAQQEERARNADDKWERELKKEIEAKRAKAGGKAAPGSADAKLSKADRELRQQQFAAEAAVRARVAEHKARVRLALDVLEAVLEGVLDSIGPEAREAFGVWTADVLETLMAVVERELVTVRRGKSVVPCGALAGSRAVSLLFELGHASVDYLGDEVTIDGVLAFTLRAIGVDEKADHGIPAKYLSGTLAGTTRKMAEELAINFSASAPLEAPAFALVFPLLRAVIAKEGRIAQLKEKTHTALVMACSDVLLSHCTIPGPHRLVPRHDMALCLVRLLDEFPRLRVAARGGLLALTIAAAGEDEDGEDKDDKESTTQAAGAVDNTTTGVSLVLLDGTLSDEESVRESALAGLSHLPIADAVQETFDTRVWVARSDASEAVRAEALKLWEDVRGADAVVSEALIPEMVRLTVHPAAAVRESAGRALCAALAVYPREVAATLEALFGLYSEKAADPVPEYDDYGMVIPESLNRPDEWQARAGIAHALKACVPVLGEANAMAALFEFLIAREALGDRNSTVQQRMLDAGLSAISESGKQHVRDLLDRFDGYLSQPAKASETHDRIREGVVILLGTVAQHLDATDPRIPEVVDKLIATLETPSELVQVAVSECLPALIKVSKERAPRLIATLMDRLYTAPKYGSRRGAAYGLAGIVKGYGIAALKECNVMTSLRLAVEDKKTPNRREGALFAYETLSYTLGRSFEPYVIQILPFLLVCFGDSSKQIREATEDTCRVIMSKLSAHCVKLVLPSLIDGLSDKAWRTKTGSLEVMASMSALAPKQLSQSLPMIVPSICDALTDSHQKVQEAARQALVTFGNVIKNPEIQEIVPTLIAALVDPNHQTLAALSALLDTTFVHYIDAPSLALLVPIIHRGMRERSADIKKRAAQIMGNMSSLTDQRDLVPYLRTLVPALKEVLVDPVPEARSTAAKAFGSMIEKLGEDNFPGLVAELLQTLKSDASSVDRSGAAQGLSEVLAGLGLERLEGMLPEIVASTSSARMFVREGFMTLLVYLPATFGEAFTPYIATIIPSILQGLADEGETVREVALRAGQVVVRGYAKSAINLLLPELERGLFDNNWRIRQNSMQLLGDLLFRIAGVSSKIDTDASGDQDEGLGTEHGRQALRDALGRERYETVLASVYIIRGDASAVVRQSSLHVWKAIVTNTPRTLKEILPHIMRILIASLASSNLEKRGVAARTLGDLVRKMGENVLAEIVPIFESGLDSDLADVREGVCVGMTEIMAAAGKSQLVDFVVYSTPLIKRALVDPEPSVREAAAQTFDVLHQHLGNKAIDDILPSLLNDLKTDATGFALEALKEIMAVRSNVVFPVLIPTLITRPITQFNAQALGSLISVAGLALNRRLATILPALMDALHQNDDAVPAVRETLGVLLSSIQGDDGVHQAIGIMTEAVRDGSTADKESGCEAFGLFFEGASESFEPYIGDSMQMLIGMLSGTDGDKVLESSWRAVDALVKRIKKDDMDRYVSVVRRGVRDAELCLSVGEDIPGFNIPKGLAPILPILLQGLMYGSPDTREQAALGLGEVVGRTSEAALKPYVTQITGPLIRVIGDRFPANVKSAILQTMALLLDRVPAMLRPFLPQLQRTFVKSLSDGAGTAAMRSRAARCLSLLIPLQARLDPLVVELSQSLKTTEDGSIKPAVWEALYGLLKGVGEGGREISDASRKLLHGLVVDPLQNNRENDTVERTGASKCLGAFCLCIPADEARAIIRQNMLTTGEERPWYLVHAALLSLARILEDAPAVIEGDNELVDQVAELACAALLDTKGEVTDIAVEVAGRLLSNGGFGQSDRAHTLIERLIEVTAPGIRSNETRREAAVVLKNLAKSSHKTIAPFMGKLVPALMVGVRDRVIPIKLASERALVHVLQIKAGTRVLQKYLDMLDAASARNIGDYARRVLAKIGERDSDAEDAVFD